MAENRRSRDDDAVERALQRLSEAARGDDNLMPLIIAAVEVRATLGEVSDTLRQLWGEYRAAS